MRDDGAELGNLRAIRRRAIRLPHRSRARSALILVVMALGLLAVSTSLVPTPRLIWNASASAPIGAYWRLDGPPSRGALVLAWAPIWARGLAAERGYLPLSVPLVKRVVAVAGDMVCMIGHAVTIDGAVVAHRRDTDRLGRPLPRWSGCQTLGAGEFFLLMADVPDSFDGRYFGVVEGSAILGPLVPLWTR